MISRALLITLSILFLPLTSAAQETPPVVVSEIAWTGSPLQDVDAGQRWRYEWVELFNRSAREVSLEGWSLEFSREETDLLIELSGSVEPGGFFLVVSSEKIAPSFHVNYGSLAGRMVNSGQLLVLRNGEGDIVEHLDFRSGWPAGDNETKRPMERISYEESGEDPFNWTSSLKEGGTPGEKNAGGALVRELRGREKEEVLPLEKRSSLAPLLLAGILLASCCTLAGFRIFGKKL